MAGKYTNLGHFYIQLTCSVCLINCCFIKYFAVVLFPFDTFKLSNSDLSLRLCMQSIYNPKTLHMEVPLRWRFQVSKLFVLIRLGLLHFGFIS